MYSKSSHTYTYTFTTLGVRYVIDATQYGNFARYLNHSHEPNCKSHEFYDNGYLKIYIYSCRDIKASEELTYDYNLEINDAKKLLPCLCEAVFF